MTDDQHFLQAILDSPSDDVPRLMYADWLEEQGEPRGEFVRVQIERIRRGDYCHSQRWLADDCCSRCDVLWALEVRERDLLIPHWHDWSRRVATYCRNFHTDGAFGVLFRRGFVEEIHLPHDTFLQHAAALFAAHPITKVVLTDKEPEGGFTAYDKLRRDWNHPRQIGYHEDATKETGIATELYGLLKGYDALISKPLFRTYLDRQAALDALSTACVLYGNNTRKE